MSGVENLGPKMVQTMFDLFLCYRIMGLDSMHVYISQMGFLKAEVSYQNIKIKSVSTPNREEDKLEDI